MPGKRLYNICCFTIFLTEKMGPKFGPIPISTFFPKDAFSPFNPLAHNAMF